MPSPFAGFRHAHMIGVKGAGMAGLAELLVGAGLTVTGSDVAEEFFTDAVLKRLNIEPLVGFDPKHLPASADVIIYSTAYVPESNPELAAALSSGRKTLSYPEAVGLFTEDRLTLAVTGTHGKTTTAAMLALALQRAGEEPAALLGSRVREWGGNALSGVGRYFVLEADEYQNKLAHYKPFAAILTSVDWDHPDFFPDVAGYEQVFRDFLARLPLQGTLVVSGDHARALQVSEDCPAERVRYGFMEDNDVRITECVILDPRTERGAMQEFRLKAGERDLGLFRLAVPGEHNAANAAAAVALCHTLKIDLVPVREALLSFRGVERRFELKGERRGVLVYDDYAHHPAEVAATLKAFREHFPENTLRVVFHPHTFSRTAALLQEFSQSFDLADQVLLLDIYGSAREEHGGVSSRDLERLMNTYRPGTVECVGDAAGALERLRQTAEAGDVIITMGAGSVWEVGRGFLATA